MHRFDELADRCARFTIATLKAVEEEANNGLELSGATVHIKALQMGRMQRAILAVGMFSLFEANLQDHLGNEGFGAATSILTAAGETDIKQRFDDVRLAVNVLKHGYGRSFDALAARAEELPFDVRLESAFFCEGDVAEVSTLIVVNDDFVQLCADVISEVSGIIRRDAAPAI